VKSSKSIIPAAGRGSGILTRLIYLMFNSHSADISDSNQKE
jgi:hypothetical protein